MTAELPAHRYIVVEGPIGVGKTSLARTLGGHAGRAAGARAGRRRIRSSSASIAIRASGALPAQLYFLFQRAQQLGDAQAAGPVRAACASPTICSTRTGCSRADARRRGVRRSTSRWHERLAIDAAEARSRGLPAGAGGRAAGAHRQARHRLREPDRRAPISSGSTRPMRGSSMSTTQAPLLIVNAANIDPISNEADYEELLAAIGRMKRAGSTTIRCVTRCACRAIMYTQLQLRDSTRPPVTLSTLAQDEARRARRSPASPATTPASRCWCDEADVDVVLVGDSLGMVIQGHDTTVPVTMDDIVYHCTRRGARPAPAVPGRRPAVHELSRRREHALANSVRLMQEGGARMVKLESGAGQLRDRRIPRAATTSRCARTSG